MVGTAKDRQAGRQKGIHGAVNSWTSFGPTIWNARRYHSCVWSGTWGGGAHVVREQWKVLLQISWWNKNTYLIITLQKTPHAGLNKRRSAKSRARIKWWLGDKCKRKKQECGASIVEYEEEEKRGICPQTTNQPTKCFCGMGSKSGTMNTSTYFLKKMTVLGSYH